LTLKPTVFRMDFKEAHFVTLPHQEAQVIRILSKQTNEETVGTVNVCLTQYSMISVSQVGWTEAKKVNFFVLKLLYSPCIILH
jgi:hypothetical protein